MAPIASDLEGHFETFLTAISQKI